MDTVDAAALAVALLGDAIYANPLMMGYAYQKGWLPLSRESLLRAIELNGQQVAANQAAFAWGARGPGPGRAEPAGGAGAEAGVGLSGRHRRTAASARAAAPVAELKKPAGELEQLVSVRREFLTRYQDAAYAARYADLVDKVAHAEREATGTQRLALAVARYAFKLMAYKDEYEVARLYSDGEFERRVAQQFEGDWKLRFHLAPPLFARRGGRQAGQARLRPGHPAPVPPAGAAAAPARHALRSVRLHRRAARRARAGQEYHETLTAILPKLNRGNLDRAVALASVPEEIRGYGHVKEAAMARAAQRREALLKDFTATVVKLDGTRAA